MKIPNIIRKIQKQQRWFKAAEKSLKALEASRNGGILAKALSTFSIAGTMMDTLFPGDSAWEYLSQKGYHNTDYAIGGFICELMLQSEIPMTILPVGLTSQINLWETPEGGVAEVARRLQIHGVRQWKSEIELIKLSAPDPEEKEKNSEGPVPESGESNKCEN